MRMPIHLDTDGAFIDYIDFEPYGTIRVCGWSAHSSPLHCEVETLEGTLQPTATYRYAREDVCAAFGTSDLFVGLSIEFRVRGNNVRRVAFGARTVPVAEDVAALLNSESPGYAALLDDDRVWHRQDIYGEGPPSDSVNPQILKFALLLQPHILDFGCGNGTLIREYRNAGMEAFGIEIERPPIRDSIRLDVAPFIRLYDGTFPLPFADGQFESVIATEVIEHVPDYEAALSEIARVCQTTFAITVPDMTCIPIGHRRGFVPWHLLEATHVNFFNHRSLAKALEPHFRSIRFFQIARGEPEGGFMPGCLAAIATK
jgi:SAM-dependent methyltransferase